MDNPGKFYCRICDPVTEQNYMNLSVEVREAIGKYDLNDKSFGAPPIFENPHLSARFDNLYEDGFNPYNNPNNLYSYYSCNESAKLYATIADFKQANYNAYRVCRVSQWMDSICKHMQWSPEECFYEARQYQSKSEFKEKSPNAYNWSLRHNMTTDTIGSLNGDSTSNGEGCDAENNNNNKNEKKYYT